MTSSAAYWMALYRRHLAIASLAVGIALGAETAPQQAVSIALLVCTVAIAVSRRAGIGLLLGLLLLSGAALGDAREESITKSELAVFEGRHVVARGWLARKPRVNGFSRTAYVNLERASVTDLGVIDTGEAVLVRSQRRTGWPATRIGQRVVVWGAIRLPKDKSKGEDSFSWRDYLRRRGVIVEIAADRVEAGTGRRGGIYGVTDRARERSERALAAGLDRSTSSLSRGMVLGADEDIDRGTVEEFRRSGLAHLLAVSGQNVMLLVVLAVPLLSIFKFGYRARLIALLPLIGIYTLLTGADPPIQRAAIMAAAGIVAALAGRSRASWYALLLAAAVTLAINPMAARDAGWQLSFAAVVSIFWLAPKIEAALVWLPHALAQGAAITVAATIFTAPLAAYHFDRVSIASLTANLLALPVVAPIMWIGMIVSAVGQIWLPPAYLLNEFNQVCLAYLLQIARWSSEQPFAVAQTSLTSWWQVALAFGSVFAAVFFIERSYGRLHRRAKVALLMALAAVVLSAAVFSGRLSSSEHWPDRFTATFIDVGQGDATLLQTPDRYAVLVDAGPPETGLADKLARYGVDGLDVVVLTHAQLDHFGGIGEVSRELKADTVLVGSGSGSRSYNTGLASLERSGAKVVEAEAGQSVKLGRMVLKVLHPNIVASERPQASDPNGDAVVLLASYGSLDLFLPADAESEDWGSFELPDIDVLKVAHHGSRDDGLEEALKELSPQAAVISSGRDNPFGHPHPSTLSSLRQADAKILRTDHNGSIRIAYKDGRAVLLSGRP